MFGAILRSLFGNSSTAARTSTYEHGLDTQAQEDRVKSWYLDMDCQEFIEIFTDMYIQERVSNPEFPELTEDFLQFLLAYFKTPEGREALRAKNHQKLLDGQLYGSLWMQWCIVAGINQDVIYLDFWRVIRSGDDLANFEFRHVLKKVFLSVGAPEDVATAAVTSIPVSRDALCNETNRRYFEFKRLKICERLKVSIYFYFSYIIYLS